MGRGTVASTLVALAVVLASTVASGPMPPAAAAITRPGPFGCQGYSGYLSKNPVADVMNDVIVVPGFPAYKVGTGDDINWKLDPYHNRTWVVEFQSLRWTGPLITTFQRTHDHTYLDHAAAIVRDWVHDNPMNTLGPLAITATGHRAGVMLCLFDVAGNTEWLLHALDAQAFELIANYSGAYNHGLDESMSLFGIGCDLERTAYRTTAKSRLAAMSDVIVDAQGVTNEQAVGYQAYVYNRLLDADERMHACADSLPEPLHTRYKLMTAFSAQSTLPDGTMAQFGDTPAAAALATPGTDAEWAGTAGRSGTMPQVREAVYTAGYAFGRSTWQPGPTATWYGIRFGPARAVHGHDDHMSLLWWARGRLVLTETGHVGYEPGWQHDHELTAEAHNVVVVPDKQFRSVPTTLTRRVVGANGTFLELRDQPYDGVTRFRDVASLGSFPAMVVYDRVTSNTPVHFEQLWHLPSDMTATASGRSQAVAQPASGDVSVRLLQVPFPNEPLPPGATAVVRGRRTPPLGWVAPTPPTWQPAPVVTMHRSGTAARFLTVIAAAPRDGRVTASLTALPSGWYELHLTVAGVTRTVRVSGGGTLTP